MLQTDTTLHDMQTATKKSRDWELRDNRYVTRQASRLKLDRKRHRRGLKLRMHEIV